MGATEAGAFVNTKFNQNETDWADMQFTFVMGQIMMDNGEKIAKCYGFNNAVMDFAEKLTKFPLYYLF